jgi:hypothetical protein
MKPACVLYVSVTNNRRYLLVRECARFPSAAFERAAWRVVAHGVEMSLEAKTSLEKQGYYEYWAHNQTK